MDLRDLVASRLGVDRSAVGDSALLLEDLALDSLALIELAMVIEAEYAVQITDDDLFDAHTFSDLQALVSARRR